MRKKKRNYLKLALLILVISVGLTACSKAKKEEVQVIPDFEEEIEEKENDSEKTAKAYKEILEKIEDYDFDGIEEEEELVEYKYSLVNMGEENEVQMLVAKDTYYGLQFIRAFSYDLEKEEIIRPDTILTTGIGGGGYRGSLSQLEDKAALEYINLMSGTGAAQIEHIKIEESELTEELVWEGRIDQFEEERALLEIDWIPISDLSKLRQLAEGKENFNKKFQVEEKEEPELEKNDLKDFIEKERNQGKVVLEGRIKKMTYQEVLDLQNMPDPNPGYSDLNEEYYIFVLNKPEEIAFQTGDGSGPSKGKVGMVKINEIDGKTKYLEKDINLSLDPTQTYWPTDTSVPLGEPSTSIFKIIE